LPAKRRWPLTTDEYSLFDAVRRQLFLSFFILLGCPLKKGDIGMISSNILFSQLISFNFVNNSRLLIKHSHICVTVDLYAKFHQFADGMDANGT
jgi:hypothetical protein